VWNVLPSLVLACVAAVSVAIADPVARPRIGIVIPESLAHERLVRDVLAQRGYIDGQNVVLDVREYADFDAAKRVARALVNTSPDLIMSYGTTTTRSVLDATKTIPVVFTTGDPVASGLVANLNKPGGNATGVSVMMIELAPKVLEVIRQLNPRAEKVAVLRNVSSPLGLQMAEQIQSAAAGVGLQVQLVDIRGVAGVEAAVPALRRTRAQVVFVPADLSLQVNPQRVVRAIRQADLPAVYQDHIFVEAGGLLSYGHYTPEVVGGMVMYADLILKGAKPGDLPIEQIRTLRLVVNMRAARELGIIIPEALLVRADDVIN
jgi:putative ABC transport system substrate-binding protein